jgi:hypothetical protein
LLEALRFTSGVSICSNDRVTFKKIHTTRIALRAREHSLRNAANPALRTIAAMSVVTASWTRPLVRIC